MIVTITQIDTMNRVFFFTSTCPLAIVLRRALKTTDIHVNSKYIVFKEKIYPFDDNSWNIRVCQRLRRGEISHINLEIPNL